MRALLQRVSHGRVSVDGRTVAEIGPGLVILVGVAMRMGKNRRAPWRKRSPICAFLKIQEGKMNLSTETWAEKHW